VQFFSSSLEKYEQFLIAFAEDLQEAARGKWGAGFIGFRTLMTDDLD
jgi:hypothetical protein